jgi:hypothetical protein
LVCFCVKIIVKIVLCYPQPNDALLLDTKVQCADPTPRLHLLAMPITAPFLMPDTSFFARSKGISTLDTKWSHNTQVRIRPAMESVASVLRTQEVQCSVPRPVIHMTFYLDLLSPGKFWSPLSNDVITASSQNSQLDTNGLDCEQLRGISWIPGYLHKTYPI